MAIWMQLTSTKLSNLIGHPLRARATTRTFVRPLVANAMFLGLRLPISEFKRRQTCNSTQPIFATLKSFGNAFSSWETPCANAQVISTMIRISKYRKYNKYNGVMDQGSQHLSGIMQVIPALHITW